MSPIISLVLGSALQILHWSYASGHLLRLMVPHSTFLAYVQGHFFHEASLGRLNGINGCLFGPPTTVCLF